MLAYCLKLKFQNLDYTNIDCKNIPKSVQIPLQIVCLLGKQYQLPQTKGKVLLPSLRRPLSHHQLLCSINMSGPCRCTQPAS